MAKGIILKVEVSELMYTVTYETGVKRTMPVDKMPKTVTAWLEEHEETQNNADSGTVSDPVEEFLPDAENVPKSPEIEPNLSSCAWRPDVIGAIAFGCAALYWGLVWTGRILRWILDKLALAGIYTVVWIADAVLFARKVIAKAKPKVIDAIAWTVAAASYGVTAGIKTLAVMAYMARIIMA